MNSETNQARINQIRRGTILSTDGYGDVEVKSVQGNAECGAQYFRCKHADGDTVEVTQKMITGITLFHE